MNYIQILDVFFIAGFIAYLLTPFIRTVATKFGYLDHPQDNKVHAHPMPLLGGVSIFAAFAISLLTKEAVIALPPVRAILIGALILFIIGLIDDKMGMMPNFKLLGQFLAAMIIIKSGLRIEFVNNYYLSIVITYIWIIGITNALNLLDNMNGLSAGIAAIAAVFFGIISYLNGQHEVSAVAFALAGGALGFIKYNFPKASIFMGDTGSLVLGYVLSAIAIMGNWKTYILTTSIMVPILVLGYPIFDTTLVSVMRILERRSIFQGGKDHSSHRLALIGFKRFKTVLIIYAICIFLGLMALAISNVHWRIGIPLLVATVVIMLLLGVRLSLVDTKRYGRKKGAYEN
ncbi:MAG: MraY family glycosyltransferase [Candidatus Omnitrophica bacterium]|nr:MraY family glycosyltransferase [Candidatus Omnitrophota bacterium]MDD5435947.1 MraY family glycosyltransferase [Candidatus Omnitrophota bacterium]